MHFSAKRGLGITCRLSVRPSVSLSVTSVDCYHIGWNSSKIIYHQLSLATQTSRVYSKRNTPKFSPEYGWGAEKKWLSAYKNCNISETRQDRTEVKGRIGSHIRAFDWCQKNQWPWMTLKGHYALCFKTCASFRAHCGNLNENRSILSATKM